MHSHPFDPVSAVLALIALVAGILVIAGSTLPFEANVGPWLAAVALVFGVFLLPWSISRGHAPADPDDDELDRQASPNSV